MPHDHNPDESHALLPSEPALRLKALETILTRKGLIDPAAIDVIIDTYENRIGPRIGAEIVARAWTEPSFRAALLDDAETVLQKMGLAGRQGEHVRIVENTEELHNMVVCTLCSCYPWPLLGIPPSWYKSDAYRRRAVSEPRAVLREFNLDLPAKTAIRVWDSTAEIRYLVLPMQPEESRGLNREELAKWVTRDAMIGTGLPRPPTRSDGVEA